MSTSSPEFHASRPTADDLRACRALMRGGSKTFFAASLLLPSRVRAPASALYAFCRLADDAVDLGENPLSAMRDLQERLDGIYAGRPRPITADRALAVVVHRFAIPRALLDALLDGFVWDTSGRRYETLDDVRNGRLYLPRSWLREAGIDPDAWLAAPRFDAAIGRVIQRLLDAADELYRRAEAGICALPRDCRPAICAARLVYAEIGRQLEQLGLDSVSQRAVVSRQRKLGLIARATASAFAPSGGKRAAPPALPAVQYLVDACEGSEPDSLASVEPIGQVGRVIELFERQMVAQRAMR
jgi:15-cis-phytoene synthase